MFPLRYFGPPALIEMRRAAVIARLGYDPAPPRIAIVLAKIAAWSAIGGVAAVLAMPVLAVVDALLGH